MKTKLLPGLLLLLCATVAHAALHDRFPDLVQADPTSSSSVRPATGVRITYLGTNAYLLESRDAVVLIDPYFSRQSFLRAALKLRTRAEPARVDHWLAGVPRIDGVLVTHGHVDHLFDVPQILKQRPRAVLHASATGVHLALGAGVQACQLDAVRPGSVVHMGGATVRVLRATHDRVLGKVPFEGPAKHYPPTNVDDWICGEPLSYLIEIGGKRIYLASGSVASDRPDAGLGRIDLAIQGAASPDALGAWPRTLARLQPKLVLPSHMDNFFNPLDRGFSFLPGTDFRRAREIAEAHSKVILLDYFQPWTLR
ncbi:MAG TPA: MBL fold metallo-hydrolase [Chthoniobacteraceae bacterium]|jgi:L-ascorbate metabolism protein UlaG (beta-lactamase superfamily)|nr:MBL fold metallo-hydrolase [Chthoniobacteraceae bacterium]